MTPPWAPRDSVGQASSKHLAWRWILVILILLICTRAWSQTYQTSFAEVGVDRIRDAFKPDAVFQVDPPTGAVELNLPMGPGIGAGAIRFTPTLTGHLTENITFDVYGFRDDRNLLTTHPVFISILPGYLDLKTGPEADRDFSTYVSQYEIWNGVSGSFDGPLTEADKAIEAQALVRAFGYLAENVAVMRPFGLPGAACEFAKFTTSGDIFIALQSDAAPLFTLPIWLGDRSWWRHETPTKALLIRSGTAYEFTSEYREASGISAAQYGARVNRFRLTGIRDKFAGRIDIQYKGGPNCIDYQATWIRDHAPTGVAVTVADNCRGAINVDYSSASADRPAVDGYEITGSWAVPDVTHPIYLEYIGLNGKNDARLADFVPFITKGMYLRINKVRNKTTNQATSINWATYPFEVYNASYTIPESISCSSGYKAKFTWQTYLYQRNDARNGVWQGYFAKLQTNEKVKSNWMVGVTLVTETDGAGQERKTDYYRSVPRPQNPSGSNDWGGYPEFRTLITYPDGSLVWEDYWQPVQGSDGGPSRSLTEQYQMLAHLKHVVKERRFYGAGRHLYAVTDLNFGPEASAADKIIEYRDLDIRRDGIPGESVQASTIPAPSTIVTWDKVRGVRETVTLKAWQGSPAFAWAEIDRTVAQDGGGAQETRTDRSFSPLLQYGLFPRPSTEATTILADTNGGLAAGYSLPWTLPSLQTDFDPADPVLDRVASQTLAGASESIRTTYSYRSQAGLLADQVDSLQMSSPQLAGTVGIASYGYDPLGRRCSIRQQGAAWATGQSADGLGRVTSQTDANGFHTSFQWDGSSRLTDITPPMPMVPTHVEYAADQHGVIVTRGDPAHNRMEDRYDAFGQRVLTRRLVLGKKVGHKVYVYDPGGRKTFESVWLDGAGKDADGLSSKGLTGDRWVYDGLGRITDHTDPNGRVTHTDYAGLTRTVTVAYRTPEAMATSFRADALGRLIEVTDPLGQATRYGYEPGGKLASAVQGGQTRQWSYNGLGMLLASTQPESGTTLYRDLTVTGKPRRVVHQGDGSGPAQVLDYGYDELMRTGRCALVPWGQQPDGRSGAERSLLCGGQLQPGLPDGGPACGCANRRHQRLRPPEPADAEQHGEIGGGRRWDHAAAAQPRPGSPRGCDGRGSWRKSPWEGGGPFLEEHSYHDNAIPSRGACGACGVKPDRRSIHEHTWNRIQVFCLYSQGGIQRGESNARLWRAFYFS